MHTLRNLVGGTPRARRSRLALVAGCVIAGLLAACSPAPAPVHRDQPTTSEVGRHSSPATVSPPPPSPSTSASTRAVQSTAQLPRGGTRIIGHCRVVADYGTAGGPQLGVLGAGSPMQAARAAVRRARAFDGYGLPVQPAMELIATVAQGSPGPDGAYSRQLPLPVIQSYLAAAHRYRLLLILDLQPGRTSFLAQAEALRPVLLDPSVGLGLDPEWKVDSGAPGGGRIGSTTAGQVNAVTDWLSHLVVEHHLPDKLEIVHEFTLRMVQDRADIRLRPGVQVTFHADGFGSQAAKRNVFAQLHFPGHPFGTGFKLFLTQDRDLMTPAQVMRLRPRPDVITYQ